MNCPSICLRISPSSVFRNPSSSLHLRRLQHPLAFLVRSQPSLSLTRCYSEQDSQSSSSRPTLTLDDVLPASPASAPPQPFERPLPPTPLSPASNLPRHTPRSFGSMRPTTELTSDPLRRRSGERTVYSLLVRSTSNNTRLTLTHTPVAHLPGSWPGHVGFQKAYPLAGAVVARVTGGSVGFKRGKRQEFEAATQASLAMFGKIRELVAQSGFSGIGALIGTGRDQAPAPRGTMDMSKRAIKEGLPRELEIVFDGFGNGRDAFVASLMGAQGAGIRELVRAVRDKTVVKIGGPRPKKRRRV